MGKKLFTLFVSFVLIITTFVYPVMGSENEPQTTDEVVVGPGGLDFYSLTIYYDTPTVVDYKFVSKTDSQKDDLIYYYNAKGTKVYKEGYIFGEPADKYILRAGDSRDTAYTMYKNKPTGYTRNFNGIESDNLTNEAMYSKFPSKYAYITHIQDNTSILSEESIFLYGLTRPSDDAGHVNPNFVLRDDGYIKTFDDKYKIDINGYLLYENDEWKDKEGNVIALFRQEKDGDTTKLALVDRIDPNTNKVKFLSHADEGLLYRVNDINGDGTYDESEIMKNAQGHLLRGEPVQGIPARKNKITRISLEIDALGTQLYTDVSQDPQQQNEIIFALNDWYENILVDQQNAPKDKKGNIINPEKIKGQLVGSFKSITTKTEPNFTDKEKITYKSVDLDLTEEQLNSLPQQADINLTFKIKTQQPENAFDEKQTEKMITIWIDLKEVEKPVDEEINWVLYGSIAGGALVVIAVVIIIIVVTKKKKNATVEIADNPPSSDK